ncbi:MAG TPA: hypothetical protein VF734_06485 [Pseudonocardiaceae bacterium]
MIVARTDVVGSLLRLRTLLQARERLERGEIGPPEFKRVEDAAVAEAIRLQEGLVKGGYDWLVQRHIPLERLTLSPQCGFATSILGNALTTADEQTNSIQSLRPPSACGDDGPHRQQPDARAGSNTGDLRRSPAASGR